MVTLKWSLHKHIVLFPIVILGKRKYWGTLWKSIGKLRELDVNTMGIFWELGEFGGNTLRLSKFKKF